MTTPPRTRKAPKPRLAWAFDRFDPDDGRFMTCASSGVTLAQWKEIMRGERGSPPYKAVIVPLQTWRTLTRKKKARE